MWGDDVLPGYCGYFQIIFKLSFTGTLTFGKMLISTDNKVPQEKTMKIIEINSNATFELILRRKGRLILKGDSTEVVVLGFGSNKQTMLHDLNNSSVAKCQGLRFKVEE